MHWWGKVLSVLPLVLKASFARDGFSDDLKIWLGTYEAPRRSDSRGPCPALNTLANHGLLNRNGSDIRSTDLVHAVARGFGVASDCVQTAVHNFEVICEYVKGHSCRSLSNPHEFILTNLTILGEPHLFEHDHSYSRQDYKQAYAHGAITDNIYFNATEFQSSLDVIGYHPTNPPHVALANYSEFNTIRLQRESLQYRADQPGSFQQSIPIQLFETGFIFGATFNRHQNGQMIGNHPEVRVDWWNFWFSEESFPTHLGWVPAPTAVFVSSFVTSVSSAVLDASALSTPSVLPPDATKTKAHQPTDLPHCETRSNSRLYQSFPYVAPTPPSHISSEKNTQATSPKAMAMTTSVAVENTRPSNAVPLQVLGKAISSVGAPPHKHNFYEKELEVSDLHEQAHEAQCFQARVEHAISSIVHHTDTAI